MDIQEAARLYSSLNVVLAMLRGDDEGDPGLIVRLEKAADLLDKSYRQLDQVKASRGVLDASGDLKPVLAELKRSIQQIVDDVSVSAAEIQSEKMIQAVQKNAARVACKAAMMAVEANEKREEDRMVKIYRWGCLMLSALSICLACSLVLILTG